MTSMNISLPEPLRQFVEEQVETGGYGTASEYVRGLLREAQKLKAQERLEELLLEGLSTPVSEMTGQDWQEIRQEIRERLAQRKQRA
jgi:antitoxin ParD1/3/4